MRLNIKRAVTKADALLNKNRPLGGFSLATVFVLKILSTGQKFQSPERILEFLGQVKVELAQGIETVCHLSLIHI